MKNRMFIKDYFNELMRNTVEDERLNEMVERAKDILVSAIENHTVCECVVELEVDERRVEALENYLHLLENREYQRVYYYTVVKTISEIMTELAKREKEYQEYSSVKSYKYLYPVLQLLARNNLMEQKVIAESLNISSQSLSNFFRRTNHLNYWSRKKVGKQSLYIITAQGRKAYRFYKKQDLYTEESGQLERILITAFSETAKVIKKGNFNGSDYVLHTLNTRYSKGTDLFNSQMLKHSLDSVFLNARDYGRDYLPSVWAEIKKKEQYMDDEAMVLLTSEYYNEEFE
ncbi:MAG: hypothetical protein HFI34_08390 [Lachnospiraceae bacterium]|nr:hypothetical protein [Lachnospiraceae bacterium]